MDKRYAELNEWSNGVAQIVTDALLDANIIDSSQFDRAAEIVTEEITMRLLVGDHPPLDSGSASQTKSLR